MYLFLGFVYGVLYLFFDVVLLSYLYLRNAPNPLKVP